MVSAFISVTLALGLPVTRPADRGASPASTTSRAAVSAARRPISCPGYRRIDDSAAREHVERVWGIWAAGRRLRRPACAPAAPSCARLLRPLTARRPGRHQGYRGAGRDNHRGTRRVAKGHQLHGQPTVAHVGVDCSVPLKRKTPQTFTGSANLWWTPTLKVPECALVEADTERCHSRLLLCQILTRYETEESSGEAAV